ncbi:hypothetical protein EFP18_20920 [Burkholderia glumae]|nr:hypothetical protein CEQ24_018070 [Burkholderia glumae]UVS86608.1 hypothetical protein EFP18_20920 [Burkholderia glumae]UVT04352.1 hypothetical protein EFP20_23935 [Burkholderia glumae]
MRDRLAGAARLAVQRGAVPGPARRAPSRASRRGPPPRHAATPAPRVRPPRHAPARFRSRRSKIRAAARGAFQSSGGGPRQRPAAPAARLECAI